MQLIVLLTHHFNDIFLNTLLKLNHSVNTDYKIIVLFDNKWIMIKILKRY